MQNMMQNMMQNIMQNIMQNMMQNVMQNIMQNMMQNQDERMEDRTFTSKATVRQSAIRQSECRRQVLQPIENKQVMADIPSML